MSTEMHIFHSKVFQVDIGVLVPRVENLIPIILHLYKERRFWFDGPGDFTSDGGPIHATSKGLLIAGGAPRDFLSEQLTVMGIPQEEVPAILEKILWQLYLASNVSSDVPITVIILDISVSFLGSADYHDIVDWVASEPFTLSGYVFSGEIIVEDDMVRAEYMETYKVNLIAATSSAIEGLEKLRLDSVEDSVIRNTPSCVICLEDFAECVNKLITSLPCNHLYHVDCLVRSLKISHICPLCRYPMPTVEANEPSRP